MLDSQEDFQHNVDNGPSDAYPGDQEELTEQQLRELYDAEEIERFLILFSAYVTEVRVADSASAREQTPLNNTCDAQEKDFLTVDPSSESTISPSSPVPVSYERSFSEEIAFRYVVPILAPSSLPPQPFTLGRLRLTTQRFYLAVQPYRAFFDRLVGLATWKDTRTSLFYCVIYWVFWWYDLLLPSLLLRILFALVRRKIFPHPTLNELREHREEAIRAEEFGEQTSARLSATSSGLRDIWRLFNVLKQNKNKAKRMAKDRAKEAGLLGPSDDSPRSRARKQDATVLDDVEDSDETEDIKRDTLQLLGEIADLHERVRNIFIWRRPASSRFYGLILSGTFLATLLLPSKHLGKIVYFIGGFLFWHVVPILTALSPSQRARLPVAFSDVPTDVDYAMELISRRVAAGLDVKPRPSRKQQYLVSGDSNANMISGAKDNLSQASNPINWKKWGDRVALGKSVAHETKRIITGKQYEAWPPLQPAVPQNVIVGQPKTISEVHTYPCQHTSSPGLISITPKSLLFTPLMSQNAKIIMPFDAIKSIKKSGMLKGLNICWIEEGLEHQKEKEECFLWVGARDDLFARLISTDGPRWMNI